MAGELRNNAGRVYQNLDKRKAKSPDYTGRATIDGVEYVVSAWHDPPSERIRKGSFGLRFTRADSLDEGRRVNRAKRQAEASPEPPAPRQRRIDDDIPF